MKPQRITALILALACTLTTLAACGRRDDAAEETHEPLTIVSLFPEMDHFIKKVHETYPEIRDEQNSWKELPPNKANGNQKSLGHLKGAKTTAR